MVRSRPWCPHYRGRQIQVNRNSCNVHILVVATAATAASGTTAGGTAAIGTTGGRTTAIGTTGGRTAAIGTTGGRIAASGTAAIASGTAAAGTTAIGFMAIVESRGVLAGSQVLGN